MRRTKKYTQAVAAARALGVQRADGLPHEQLYLALAERSYCWDGATWAPGTPESSSVFKTYDDQPSGVVKLRVMAHPDEIEEAVRLLRDRLPGAIYEVSDPYPNRKGVGVRVYVSLKLEVAR
jgi:hypothetical protein